MPRKSRRTKSKITKKDKKGCCQRGKRSKSQRNNYENNDSTFDIYSAKMKPSIDENKSRKDSNNFGLSKSFDNPTAYPNYNYNYNNTNNTNNNSHYEVKEEFSRHYIDKNKRGDNSVNVAAVIKNEKPLSPIALPPVVPNYKFQRQYSASSHSSTSFTVYSSDRSCSLSQSTNESLKKNKKIYDVVEVDERTLTHKRKPNIERNSDSFNKVIVEKSIVGQQVNNNSLNEVPVLDANHRYNISFGLDRSQHQMHSQNPQTVLVLDDNLLENLQKQSRNTVVSTKEIDRPNQLQHHQHHHHHRRKYRRSNKKLQIGQNLTEEKAIGHSDFEGLVKDINFEAKRDKVDNREASRVGQQGGGMSASGGGEEASYFASEMKEVREWMIIEQGDGTQVKREYRKELNSEGDVKYIDVKNGNVLKQDVASWKKGSEWYRDGKKRSKINYEWRKDKDSGEWVKYNSDTNEILKRGDWKSGSEWYRNSRGKYEERIYQYIQQPDGTWAKSDKKTGKLIDFFQSSNATTGHLWKKSKGKTCGRDKNPQWQKLNYEYVQDEKGRWFKRDLETKKRIGKYNKTGWKQGRDYHMDENGKISRVKYRWETQNDGFMHQMIRKKKKNELLNNNWKEGNEVIMRGDEIVRNDFEWVKTGRNKWRKINQETGLPLTNQINGNKIHSYNSSDLNKHKSYLAKSSKHVANNQIVEEDTKIQQDGGGIIRNTTKTIKPIK